MGRGNSVFEEAFGSIRDIPRNAWVMALFTCGTSAVTDLIFWDTRERLSWLWTVPLVTLAAFWFAAVYVTVFGILQICTTWQSFARFSLASFALVLPFGLTLLVLIAAKTLFSADARLSILLGGMVFAFLFSSWLVAWPVAQSLSSRFVSPTRVFRATQGHRGSLLFVAFATAGIYKSDLLPKMSKADNAGEAILIALGNALLGVLVIAVTAAIAAAAWRFAVRNDPTLDPASFR